MAQLLRERGSLGNPRTNGDKTDELISDTDSIIESEAEEAKPSTKRNQSSTQNRGDLNVFLSNIATVPIAQPIQSIVNHYSELMKHFDKYSYALTISPKATAFTKTRKVSDQYKAFKTLCHNVFDQCEYIAFYEMYKDGENLHMHSIIKFKTLNQFTETRKAIYKYITGHHLEKRASYKPLIDMSRVSDLEKWSAYCIKDIEHTYALGLLPTFKIQH